MEDHCHDSSANRVPQPISELNPAQLDDFVKNGWVLVRQGMNRSVAEEFFRAAEQELLLQSSETASVDGGIFLHGMVQHNFNVHQTCPRVHGAICQLIGGSSRLKDHPVAFDRFIARPPMPGASPQPAPEGWHLDGWQRPFCVYSPDIGLICFWLLSDVKVASGGTLLAPDSVGPVARLLHRHPGGVPPETLHGEVSGMFGHIPGLLYYSRRRRLCCCARRAKLVANRLGRKVIRTNWLLSAGPVRPYWKNLHQVEKNHNLPQPIGDSGGIASRVVCLCSAAYSWLLRICSLSGLCKVDLVVDEVVGKAGDVVICHPFMLHTGCKNPSQRQRFLGVSYCPLAEPLNLETQTPSPVERCVLQALQSTC